MSTAWPPAIVGTRPFMHDPATARSFLFVPATRPERISKALASAADAVIVDLEDAVAPADKDAARTGLLAALAADARVFVRINSVGTPWHDADRACLDHPGIAGVMLAKAEAVGDVAQMPKPVIPLIETARGLATARDIARVPGVVRLAFGTIDFMLDLGLPEDADAMAIYRAELALASRLAGIAPVIDGVTPAIDDVDRIVAETRRALAFGFGARLCIHPAQIGPVHDAMRPDDEAVRQARRIVEAAEAAGGGAIRLDGAMLDRPLVAQAEALLARAGDDRQR